MQLFGDRSKWLARVALSGLSLLLIAGCTALPPVQPTSLPEATSTRPAATRRPTPVLMPVDNVQIEVLGRTVQQTIGPRRVVRVALSDAPLEIRVRYPKSIEGENSDVNIVQPSTVTWSVSIMSAPDPNTFDFGLLGYEPGLMTVEVTMTGFAPVRFSVMARNEEGTPATGVTPGSATVVASGPVSPGPAATLVPATGPAASPSATPQASAGGRTITMSDNQGTISMHVGERALLSLGEGYDWTVTSSNPAVLERVRNVTVVRGAQGIYEALSPGSANLSADGDPPCRKSQPPCMQASLHFQAQVTVQ